MERTFFKVLTAIIAVSLFYVVYKDKSLDARTQTKLLFVWLLFLMWSAIV